MAEYRERERLKNLQDIKDGTKKIEKELKKEVTQETDVNLADKLLDIGKRDLRKTGKKDQKVLEFDIDAPGSTYSTATLEKILAYFVVTESINNTAKEFNVTTALVKSLIENNPILYNYLTRVRQVSLVQMFKNLAKKAGIEIDRRLTERPESFKPLDLNAIVGTSIDKLRVLEGKAEKIIKFEGEGTMKSIFEELEKELIDARPKEEFYDQANAGESKDAPAENKKEPV